MIRVDDFLSIPLDTPDWHVAGMGSFRPVGPDVVESEGGPGVFWYAAAAFADFVLRIEWAAARKEDNSGVFLRIPPLVDWQAVVEHGFEVQIDDRGYNPNSREFHDPLHQTGAVYGFAPARLVASRDLGEWNLFEITVRGHSVEVALNGEAVSRLDHELGRPRRGHIGLQAHDPKSRVRFRNLAVRPLDG